MLLRAFGLTACVLLAGCSSMQNTESAPKKSEVRSPSTIISSASADVWQQVNNDDVLRIDLPTGRVYVQLNPQLAPGHVDNIKKLAREGFYDGLNVYRFVESFVAQGGDQSGEKQPSQGSKGIAGEMFLTTENPLEITPLNAVDGYADKTGFLNGFAVAQNNDGKKTWMTHCTGTFAMARGNEIDSGGTEFYITLAPQRYLDKNTTVFGRVLEGMEHAQRLLRTPVEGQPFNPISQVRVLSDIASEDSSAFTVFDTSSEDFKELIESRKNRPSEWFIDKPNHTDVCSVSIPTKRLN